jgi:plasmid stabilization system protein ParE
MRIFYLVQGESLKVIRILHGKRDIMSAELVRTIPHRGPQM